jgi:hypothetical protein
MKRGQLTYNISSIMRRWGFPLILACVILLSQFFVLPSIVRDAATLKWVRDFSIIYPFWHLIFTPFTSIADTLTVLGLKEMLAISIWMLLFLFTIGGLRKGLAGSVLIIAFFAWAALIPRPMGRLVASKQDDLLIDFHSHSHSSRPWHRSFIPDKNIHWHIDQGFNAAFITNHNNIAGSVLGKDISQKNWRETGYRSLEGEEVTLYDSHFIVLGNHSPVSNIPYKSDDTKIQRFLEDMKKRGLPVIASLPEYWFYHWGPDLQNFIQWGLQGFEIINSVPNALEFPISKRMEIVDLCHRENLFMTGASDNHGYGYATAVWNMMKIPGWQAMDPEQLENAILDTLMTKRFNAVQVLERVRYKSETFLQLVFSPFGIAFIYWRSLQPFQAVSWVLWILMFFAVKNIMPTGKSGGMKKAEGDGK